jgi:hypothetical protein
MKTQHVTMGCSLWLLLACGGEAVNQPAAAVAPSDSSEPPAVVEPTPVIAEAPVVANDQVVGLWCQYWIPPAGSHSAAPLRRADSEQYLFLSDGRFGWRAESAPGQEPRKRSGQWRVSGGAIVLTDPAGQVIDQLAVADCPANPEAEELDTTYRCRSLNGDAFWLSKPADSIDASIFIP